MNNRITAWFTAIVFIVLGLWLSSLGWQHKWSLHGIALRGGGIAAVVAGAYCASVASRR